MPRHCSIMLPLFVLLCWTLPAKAQQPAANSLSASEAADGWILLFDGRTLSGWSPTGDADWKVEEGTIAATMGTGFLVTSRPFEDFEFKTDVWIDQTANSGVFFRCGEGNPGARACYEANIFDTHDRWPTGSINNSETSLPNPPDTIGKWNTFEILADGNHLAITVNGRTTVDIQDQRLASGPIALQEGGGGGMGLVRFRNVKIRPR